MSGPICDSSSREARRRVARRRVLQGVALGGALAALPAGLRARSAQDSRDPIEVIPPAPVDTVILVNYARMVSMAHGGTTVGYPAAEVAALQAKIDDLVARPASETQMTAKVISVAGPTSSVSNAQSEWYADMGDVAKNNAVVTAINNYLKAVLYNAYPSVWRIIIVGGHEVIPMWARAEDHHWIDDGVTEKLWGGAYANGWYTDLIETDNGVNDGGHYFTDEVYANDAGYDDGQAAQDRVLIPEFAVGRLVETPQQIVGLIDEYVARKGTFEVASPLASGSYDFGDGGAAAALEMGPWVDDTLVEPSFDSTELATRLDDKHDLVYVAGHGAHNRFATEYNANWDCTGRFYAGNHGTEGDILEPDVSGAVVVSAGCHNGIAWPNLTYRAPSGTSYAYFPEGTSSGRCLAYLATTGFTAISGTGTSNDPNLPGGSEKLGVLAIKHIMQNSSGTVGAAFMQAKQEYAGLAGSLQGVHRRVLSTFTLYGFPTYQRTTPSYYRPHIPRERGYVFFERVLKEERDRIRLWIELEIQEFKLVPPEWVMPEVPDDPRRYVHIEGVDGYIFNSGEPVLPIIAHSYEVPQGWGVTEVVLAQEQLKGEEFRAESATGIIVNSEVREEKVEAEPGAYPPVDEKDPLANLVTPFRVMQSGLGDALAGLRIVPVRANTRTNVITVFSSMALEVEYGPVTSPPREGEARQ